MSVFFPLLAFPLFFRRRVHLANAFANGKFRKTWKSFSVFCHQCCRHVPPVMMTRLPTKSAQDPGPSSSGGGGGWMSRRRRRREDHHVEQRFQEVIVDDSFASESSTGGGLLVLPAAKRPSSVRWRSSARTPTPPSVTAARPGFIFVQHLRGF